VLSPPQTFALSQDQTLQFDLLTTPNLRQAARQEDFFVVVTRDLSASVVRRGCRPLPIDVPAGGLDELAKDESSAASDRAVRGPCSYSPVFRKRVPGPVGCRGGALPRRAGPPRRSRWAGSGDAVCTCEGPARQACGTTFFGAEGCDLGAGPGPRRDRPIAPNSGSQRAELRVPSPGRARPQSGRSPAPIPAPTRARAGRARCSSPARVR
jgi:hypothetical protein